MSNLSEILQETINNLETIRDKQDAPPDEIFDILDKLYALQNELNNASIQKNTTEYRNAITAMDDAAKVTQEAIDELKKLEHSIEKVSDAVTKVGKLLSKVT